MLSSSLIKAGGCMNLKNGVIAGIVGLLAIIFVIFALPRVADQITATVTTGQTQTVNMPTLAVTNATAAIQFPLYENDIASVTSVSSTLNTDNPIITAYHSTVKIIDVEGLTPSANRTLTINYLTARSGLEDGASDLVRWIFYILVAVVIIVIVVLAIKMIF